MSSCQLSNPPNPPDFNGQYQGGWNTNQNQMEYTPPVYIVFQVLKVILTKNCTISHQIFYFLLFYISFYISRHHFFHKFLELPSALSEKKIFVTNFPFLMNSIKPPTIQPLNSQNWLSVTKVFCWCSLWKLWRLSWIIY